MCPKPGPSHKSGQQLLTTHGAGRLTMPTTSFTFRQIQAFNSNCYPPRHMEGDPSALDMGQME